MAILIYNYLNQSQLIGTVDTVAEAIEFAQNYYGVVYDCGSADHLSTRVRMRGNTPLYSTRKVADGVDERSLWVLLRDSNYKENYNEL